MAEDRLMDAGTITVQMHIPVAPSSLAFQHSEKLSAMDLTRLDGYMDGAGRLQIKSGTASEAWFDIDVMGGHAHGAVRGVYRNLQVSVVDQDPGSDKGANRVAAILTNHLKVRNENLPDKAGALKAGKSVMLAGRRRRFCSLPGSRSARASWIWSVCKRARSHR